MANFWFSSDGKDYHATPEMFQIFNGSKTNTIPNSSNEKGGGSRSSVSISIPLQSRIGKFVKIELKLRSKWLLLSEITFETGNLSSFTITYSQKKHKIIIQISS